MKKYKYIHIFFVPETKFSTACVRNINDNENGFVVSEHLFITPHKKVYEAISGFENVEFTESKSVISLINRYAPKCDYIIAHSLPRGELLINPWYYKKIVWRTWGHDVHRYNFHSSSGTKKIVKLLLYPFWKFQVRCFAAVGVANTVDRLDIKENFGDVKMFRLPYTSKEETAIMESVLPNTEKTKKILLGHSGYANDNHIEILKKLKKFSNESIEIYMVLSYGNESYIEAVCAFVEKEKIQNVKIIDKFMPYGEFVEFLSGIDIAILDNDKSYALGNISWLLYFKKKIFLNRNGVIKRAFDADGVPYSCTDEIDRMTYNEFVKPLKYENINTEMLPHRYKDEIKDWEKMLLELEND